MPSQAPKTPWTAYNCYQAQLGFDLPEPFLPRQTPPGQATVADLCPPGSWIKTNYETGPYTVRSVQALDPFAELQQRKDSRFCSPGLLGLRSWSIIGVSPANASRFFNLNDFVALNGRIVHLFPNNTDEILILEGLQLTVERNGQSRLF